MVDRIPHSALADLKVLRFETTGILFASGPLNGTFLLAAEHGTPFRRATIDLVEERYDRTVWKRRAPMNGYAAWSEIRGRAIERGGGEGALEAGKRRILAEAQGFRLAGARRARGLSRQEVADRMGVAKGRVSQIEQSAISGPEVLARYAEALGGHLPQSFFFDDGDVLRIA